MKENKSREWPGEFNLPGTSSKKSGMLRQNLSDEIFLHIDGQRDREKDGDYPVICGTLEGNSEVTLIHSFDFDSSYNFSGFERRVLFVNAGVVGIRIPNLDLPLFSKMHFRASNITNWIGSAGFELRSKRDRGVRMSWNPPLTTKIDLDSRRRAEFFFGYELSSGLKNGRAQFEVRPSFNISYLNKASWEEVHADISTIELFFGFISRDRGGAPDVGLESSLSRRPFHTKEGKRKRYYHQPHEVMLSGGNYSKKSYENGRRPAPIIRFDASEYDFGNMMRSWFAHRFVFERAAKLLWMSKQDGVGVESRLIFLSQALEFLHRETIGGELIDNEDFVALKAGLGALIAASIGKEKGNVIVQRLEYLNEPGLRKRLKDIFRAVQKPTLFVKDYKSISSAVAEYRNIFTHHLHIGKSSDVWVQEVADLSDVLEGLLELYMCRRLGLDDRKINAIIQEDCNFYRSFRGGNYNVRR